MNAMTTTTTTARTEAERLVKAMKEAQSILLQLRHSASYYGDREYGKMAKDASKVLEAAIADHAPPGTPRPGVGAAGEREWLVEKLAQGWIAWPFRHGGIGRNEYQCGRAGSGDTPTEAIANGCEVNRWFDAADDLADPAAGERARRSVRVVRGATIVNDEWTVEITDGEQTVYVETNTAGWDFLRKALAAAPEGGDGGVK